MTFRNYLVSLLASTGLAVVMSAGCRAEVDSPPVAASPPVSPDLVCVAQLTTKVTLKGSGFTPMPVNVLQDNAQLLLPSVALSRVQSVAGQPTTDGPLLIPDDKNAPALSHVHWTSPQEMRFEVYPDLNLQTGLYDIKVTNPDKAQAANFPGALAAVPAPSLKAVSPDIICDEESDQSITVTGANILVVGSTNAVAHIGSVTVPASTVTGCVDVPGTHVEGKVQLCSSATFVVPKGSLAPGSFDITIENPAPAGCKSSEKLSLGVVPAPVISSIVPPSVCDDQTDQTITINGTGFLQIGSAMPTVNLGGKDFVPTSLGGCTTVGTFAEGVVQTCTSIVIKVPTGTFTAGDYPLVITNPPPANCKTLQTVSLHDEPPPVVTKVTPSTLCQGGGALTIDGANFIPTPSVVLQAQNQASVTGSGTTVNAQGTQLTTTIGPGTVPNTTYDVVVTNPDGCTDKPPHQTVFVKPGPILYLADPEVVYNGVNMGVTVYIAGGSYASSDTVTIIPTGQNAPVTTLTTNPVAGHPNRFQAIVPKGQAAGVYDLYWTPVGGCGGVLTKAITVTQKLTITMQLPPKGVVPPFGWTNSETAVTIYRDTAAIAPGDHPFIATPRAFLNPHVSSLTDVAFSLQAVSFVNADTLNAVVPKGQKAQVYDLIVTDPDGTVGFLPNAFTVTSNAPPVITSVVPSSIVAATAQNVVVNGTDFRVGAAIALTCTDANNVSYAAPTTFGAVTCAGLKCSIPAVIDASTMKGATVPFCIVRVTNTDNTYADYSAIGVTNSSLNLEKPPSAGTNMVKARRALVASAIDATSAARFVYAIGGDSGSGGATTPYNTSEFASVDLYGKMGTWVTQKYDIGGGRSFAGSATLGRYTYVFGGSDGTNNLATARRAITLNPREVPGLDVDDILLASTGLDAGYWFYKVSAVFSNSDLDNPSGESLASDEFILKLPNIPGKKLQVKLIWAPPVDSLGVPLPNVTGYRVYRTPLVNGASGGEQLIATPSAAAYTDDATGVANSAEVPLPLGSMGKWAALPNMSVARKGAGGAIGADPATPGIYYLYAGLGLNASNAVTTTYEYLPITLASNNHQTVGNAWKAGANPVTTSGRWQLGSWAANNITSTLIAATDTYVYFGGGIDASNAGVTKVEVGKIAAGGDLGTISAVTKSFSSIVAGYGICAANGQLFTFGGAGAAPSSGATSASIVNPAPNLALNSWNSEGISLNQPRYLMGSTVQSAFIFLIGGDTGGGNGSATTEVIIW